MPFQHWIAVWSLTFEGSLGTTLNLEHRARRRSRQRSSQVDGQSFLGPTTRGNPYPWSIDRALQGQDSPWQQQPRTDNQHREPTQGQSLSLRWRHFTSAIPDGVRPLGGWC